MVILDKYFLSGGKFDKERNKQIPFYYEIKDKNLLDKIKFFKNSKIKLPKSGKPFNPVQHIQNKKNRLLNLKSELFKKELEENVQQFKENYELRKKEEEIRRLEAHFKNGLFNNVLGNIKQFTRKNEIQDLINEDPDFLTFENESINILDKTENIEKLQKENLELKNDILGKKEKIESFITERIDRATDKEEIERAENLVERFEKSLTLEVEEPKIFLEEMEETETLYEEIEEPKELEEIEEDLKKENKKFKEQLETIMEDENDMNLEEERELTEKEELDITKKEHQETQEDLKRALDKIDKFNNRIQKIKQFLTPINISDKLPSEPKKKLNDKIKNLDNILSQEEVNVIQNKVNQEYNKLNKKGKNTNTIKKNTIKTFNKFLEGLKNGKVYDINNLYQGGFKEVRNYQLPQKIEVDKLNLGKGQKNINKLNNEIIQMKDKINKYNKLLSSNINLPEIEGLKQSPTDTPFILSQAATGTSTPFFGEEGSSKD